MGENFTVTESVKAKIPVAFFVWEKVKDKILGKKYFLEITFVGTKKITELNKIYRNKNYPTDILSFPLSETAGEIYINPQKVIEKSCEFDKSYEEYLDYLLIHGLLHLKGFEHSSKMESEEIKFLKYLNGIKSNSRN